MEERRTSVFENGLIWFGAAVSIAEILTGTYFSPLGFTKGVLAILLGHVIGCAMLFFAGFVAYRLLMRVDIIVGNTLPDMIITIALCVAVGKAKRKGRK